MPYWRRYNEVDLIGDAVKLVIDGAKFISRNVNPSAIKGSLKKGFKSLKKKLTPKRFQKKKYMKYNNRKKKKKQKLWK